MTAISVLHIQLANPDTGRLEDVRINVECDFDGRHNSGAIRLYEQFTEFCDELKGEIDRDRVEFQAQKNRWLYEKAKEWIEQKQAIAPVKMD